MYVSGFVVGNERICWYNASAFVWSLTVQVWLGAPCTVSLMVALNVALLAPAPHPVNTAMTSNPKPMVYRMPHLFR